MAIGNLRRIGWASRRTGGDDHEVDMGDSIAVGLNDSCPAFERRIPAKERCVQAVEGFGNCFYVADTVGAGKGECDEENAVGTEESTTSGNGIGYLSSDHLLPFDCTATDRMEGHCAFE